MGEPLDGVCDAVSRSRIFIHWICSKPWLLFYQRLFLRPHPNPLFVQLMTQYSGWEEEESGLFAESCTAGEARRLFTGSHFSPQEKSWVDSSSLDIGLCHLEGGMMQVKSNCSFYPLQYTQSCILLLHPCTGTFLLDS